MYRGSPLRSTLNTGYIKLWACVKYVPRAAQNTEKHAFRCSRKILCARGYVMDEGTTDNNNNNNNNNNRRRKLVFEHLLPKAAGAFASAISSSATSISTARGRVTVTADVGDVPGVLGVRSCGWLVEEDGLRCFRALALKEGLSHRKYVYLYRSWWDLVRFVLNGILIHFLSLDDHWVIIQWWPNKGGDVA